MESAWATATLLTARAARTTKRLNIKRVSGEVQFYVRGMSSHWERAFVVPTCVDEVFRLIVRRERVDFIFQCQATRNVQTFARNRPEFSTLQFSFPFHRKSGKLMYCLG